MKFALPAMAMTTLQWWAYEGVVLMVSGWGSCIGAGEGLEGVFRLGVCGSEPTGRRQPGNDQPSTGEGGRGG